MPLGEHPSFDPPPADARLWRYTDLPKFVDLLTSGTLWFANVELLARDDPYEGRPGAIQFPHRAWPNVEEVPEALRRQILELCSRGTDGTPEAAFRSWFMVEEQRCIMMQSGRRDFYLNCWHGGTHESVAMWKIYGAPGAGVAVISNSERLKSALAENREKLYLGAVRYRNSSTFQIGAGNVFDTVLVKSSSYEYEREFRLVHWQTGEIHDALAYSEWNEETMRFTGLIEDSRPMKPGMPLRCDIQALIARVVVSPFAPPWYRTMIEELVKRLGYSFPVYQSRLLTSPPVLT